MSAASWDLVGPGHEVAMAFDPAMGLHNAAHKQPPKPLQPVISLRNKEGGVRGPDKTVGHVVHYKNVEKQHETECSGREPQKPYLTRPDISEFRAGRFCLL